MKIFNMDCSYKTIIFEIDKKRYEINFKMSILKGIHDIKVFEFQKEEVPEKKETFQIYSMNKGIFADTTFLIKYIWNEIKMELYIKLENNLFNKD